MDELLEFLGRIPGVTVLSAGGESGHWSVKLSISVKHPLAWRVVQELAYVLNQLSIDEPLPTRFLPVSPPPYMNGGPGEFLSWIIEPTDATFAAADTAKWLASRLPRPVEDPARWELTSA